MLQISLQNATSPSFTATGVSLLSVPIDALQESSFRQAADLSVLTDS